MTDHPDAAAIEAMLNETGPDGCSDLSARQSEALLAGAAALRALAEFRPHHPRAIVGRRYATLVVPYEALMLAREAVGAHDLGPIDLDALQAQTQADRENYYGTLDRSQINAKWGGKF